jgi:hypothetical protein
MFRDEAGMEPSAFYGNLACANRKGNEGNVKSQGMERGGHSTNWVGVVGKPQTGC